MGAEAMCTARFKGQKAEGKARLETEVLQFRSGELKLSIPFKQMSKVVARDGTLSVTFPDGTAAFDLGPAAAKWQDKILHPPSRLAKLGAKREWRVSALGVARPSLSEGARRRGRVSVDRPRRQSERRDLPGRDQRG